MKKAVLISIFLTLLLLTINTFAATYISAVDNGNFSALSSWTVGGVTPTTAPTFGDIIIVKNKIILDATSYTYWGTPGSVTIQNGGSLVRTGALSLTGSGINIIVSSTGSGNAFQVSGALTMDGSVKVTLNGGTLTSASTTLNNASTITMAGGTFSTGNLTVSGGTFNSSAGSTTTVANLNVTNSGSTTFTNGGTFNVNGSVTEGGTITNNGTMNITGNFTAGGGGAAITNNYGLMNIGGSVDLPSSSKFNILPGGKTIVEQNVTTSANQNLIVGTNVAAGASGPWADLVIKGNLISSGSGDVLVDRNGRLALYGNFTSSGGGSTFTINNGGKVFINGTTTFTGGGDHLTNNTTTSPYGVYSNNQPTYAPSSGGSSNGAAGSNTVTSVATMQSQDPDFYTWVASQPNSPLPVKLAYFRVEELSDKGVSLAWETTMEINFDRFELERAGEDLKFTKISVIKGKGSLNTITQYSFDDNQPLKGKNYYRLKMIDHDNYTDYSAVIVAYWDGVARGISLYPNPTVNHSFTINLDDNYTSPVAVSLVEARGYIVYTSTVETTSSVISLPENLVAGVYLVRISSATKQQTVRLVVN